MGRRVGISTPEAQQLKPEAVDTWTIAGLDSFDPREVVDAVDEICEIGKTAVVVVYAWSLAGEVSEVGARSGPQGVSVNE